jgi:hypothetical protein
MPGLYINKTTNKNQIDIKPIIIPTAVNLTSLTA